MTDLLADRKYQRRSSSRLLGRIDRTRVNSIIAIEYPNHRPPSVNRETSPIVTINVSGVRYQTYLSTLERYPESLLGNASKRTSYWNDEEKEYFFDRHRLSFESILYFYQSKGKLRRPDAVPLDTFLDEISFFDLGEEAINQLRHAESLSPVQPLSLPSHRCRQRLWFYLEYSQYSLLGRILFSISLLVTILSCLCLSLETLPEFEHKWENLCREQLNVSSSDVPRCSSLFTSPFFLIESICVIYFTVEFLLRLVSTPSFVRFATTFLNWTDVFSIVPYYIFLIIQLSQPMVNVDNTVFLVFRLLRLFRFLRVFRIHLLFDRLKSVRIISAALKESFVDLTIMIFILTLVSFLFGAATYFAEKKANYESFDSILSGTYWAILTLTSVGYGDLHPITPIGRVLSCLCALFGAAMLGMFISVFVDRYQRVSQRKRYLPTAVDGNDQTTLDVLVFRTMNVREKPRESRETSLDPQP